MANLTANVHLGVIRVTPPAYTGDYTVTPDAQGEILETNGKYMTNDVTVLPVPWVKPEGSKNITTNGTHDVEAYKNAVVAVPGPSGTKTITTNGTHDVTDYVAAEVQVPQGVFPTGTLDIEENGTYDVTNYASAEVNTDPDIGLLFSGDNGSGYPTNLRVVGYEMLPTDLMGHTDGRTYGYLMTYITDLILPQSLTYISRSGLAGLKNLTRLYLPNVATTRNYAFSNANNLEYVEFGAPIINQIYYSFNSSTSVKQMIFRGDIAVDGWANPFGSANAPVELYDFSHCTRIFTLSATSQLPHAGGCVIKVKQSLLSAWQNATNWNALTDVVWEGV